MEEYRRSNREKRMQPKQGKYWCNCCDANYIPANSGKCSVCGLKHNGTLKKEKNAR